MIFRYFLLENKTKYLRKLFCTVRSPWMIRKSNQLLYVFFAEYRIILNAGADVLCICFYKVLVLLLPVKEWWFQWWGGLSLWRACSPETPSLPETYQFQPGWHSVMVKLTFNVFLRAMSKHTNEVVHRLRSKQKRHNKSTAQWKVIQKACQAVRIDALR